MEQTPVDGNAAGGPADDVVRTALADLRATQGRLVSALEDIAALKVLLAMRTAQHDAAWGDVRRLEADLAAARAGSAGASEALARAEDAAARADERCAATRTVLGAAVASIKPRALDRRRFQALIAEAGRAVPESGPGTARHAVLLAEARRVLGIAE